MVEEEIFARPQEVAQSGLQVEVVSDRGRFDAIGPEWDRLVERADVDPIFLSHNWFRTWLESFGQDRQLHIVTVRSGGRLVAVAPMMRSRAGVPGLKVDSVESIYNPHTPRFDFIVDREEGAAVYEAIWRKLADGSGCGMILLAQVPDASRTTGVLEQLARNEGWVLGHWNPPPSPYIPPGCDS